MKNLNKLRDKAYQIALDNGWHEKNLSDEHFLCLVISELMEAVEADRKGIKSQAVRFNYDMDYLIYELKVNVEKYNEAFRIVFSRYIKDTIEDELADACIRLFDLAGLRNIDLDCLEYENSDHDDYTEMSFTEAIMNITRQVVGEEPGYRYIENNIYLSLNEIFAFCKQKGIDIFWHIDQKMEYNKLRGYHHGGKKY